MKPYLRLLAVPLAAAAAGAALWLLVGLPAWRALPGIRAELAERRGQLEAWSAPGRGAGAEQRNLQVAAAAAALRGAGAPAGQELEVILVLERTAEARHVVHRLSLGEPSPAGKSGWQQSQVDVEVVGSFDDVAGFLDDLRRLPWLLNISKLDLRRDQPGTVRAAVAGTLLWRPS